MVGPHQEARCELEDLGQLQIGRWAHRAGVHDECIQVLVAQLVDEHPRIATGDLQVQPRMVLRHVQHQRGGQQGTGPRAQADAQRSDQARVQSLAGLPERLGVGHQAPRP